MAFQELAMSMTADGIADLRDGFHGFFTGKMGSCATFVLLWDLDTTRGVYRHARGFHAAGGVLRLQLQGFDAELNSQLADQISLTNLFFKGVANHATTGMIIIGGEIYASTLDQLAAHELHEAFLSRAQLQIHQSAGACVTKGGLVMLDTDKAGLSTTLRASSRKLGGEGCCVIL